MSGGRSEKPLGYGAGIPSDSQDRTKESENLVLLQNVQLSLSDMTGGCEICQNSVRMNAWEGLHCTVHNRPVKVGDPRCDSFVRRDESPDLGAASRALAREYASKTFGIRGRTLKRLYGSDR